MKRKFDKPLVTILKKPALSNGGEVPQMPSIVKKFQGIMTPTSPGVRSNWPFGKMFRLTFNSIPENLIKHILHFLSQKDLISFAQVSKLNYEIASSVMYDTPVFPSLNSFFQFTSMIQTKPKLASRVTCISLGSIPHRHCEKYANKINSSLELIARSCHRITHLNLNSLTYLADSSMQIIAAELKNNLTNLNVSKCFNISNVTILALSTYCKNIVALDLSDGPKVLNASLEAIYQTWGPTLQMINLSSCHSLDRPTIINFLDNCKGLKEIELTNLSLAVWEIPPNQPTLYQPVRRPKGTDDTWLLKWQSEGLRITRRDYNYYH